MKRIIVFVIISFFSLVCLSQAPGFSHADSTAQFNSKKPYVIITNDGGEFIGYIEKMDNREVTIVTKDKGTVIIPKYTIKKIEPVTENNYKSGSYVNENIFASRYCIGNSALPVKKKELIVNTTYYTAASLDYGISDKFSIGLNTTIYGLPFMINTKAHFKIGEQLYFGPEIHAGWIWASPSSYFTYGSMKITQGTSNNNATLSSGYFFGNFDNLFWSNGGFVNYFFINGSFAKRLNPRLLFLAEAWGIGDINNGSMFPGTLLIAGFRTLKKEKSSWIFSLVTPVFQEKYRYYVNNSYQVRTRTYVIPLPYVGWSTKL